MLLFALIISSIIIVLYISQYMVDAIETLLNSRVLRISWDSGLELWTLLLSDSTAILKWSQWWSTTRTGWLFCTSLSTLLGGDYLKKTEKFSLSTFAAEPSFSPGIRWPHKGYVSHRLAGHHVWVRWKLLKHTCVGWLTAFSIKEPWWKSSNGSHPSQPHHTAAGMSLKGGL